MTSDLADIKELLDHPTELSPPRVKDPPAKDHPGRNRPSRDREEPLPEPGGESGLPAVTTA